MGRKPAKGHRPRAPKKVKWTKPYPWHLARRPWKSLTKSQKNKVYRYRAYKAARTRYEKTPEFQRRSRAARKGRKTWKKRDSARLQRWKREFREIITILNELKRRLKEDAEVNWSIKPKKKVIVDGKRTYRWAEISADKDENGEYEVIDPRVLNRLMRQCDYEPLNIYNQVLVAAEYVSPAIYDHKDKKIQDEEVKWTFLINAYDGDVAWTQAAQALLARLVRKYFSYEMFSLSFTPFVFAEPG